MDTLHCDIANQPMHLKMILYGTLGIGIGALAAAFFVEYVLLKPPCVFCIYERFPYGALIFFSLLGLCVYHNTRAVVWTLLGNVVSCVVSAGMTFYHVLIERHWVQLPKICGGGLRVPDEFEQLKAYILGTKIVPCDQVPLRVFGFSLAELNLSFSLIVAIMLSLMVCKIWPRCMHR